MATEFEDGILERIDHFLEIFESMVNHMLYPPQDTE